MTGDSLGGALAQQAAQSSVASLFASRVAEQPDAIALAFDGGVLSYRTLGQRVGRLANVLLQLGVTQGSRVFLLSENRAEYLEITLAAAHIGAIVACQNWRLSDAEISECVRLVEPALGFVSPKHAGRAAALGIPVIQLGDDYAARLGEAPATLPAVSVDPEAILLLLYTSGTTRLPKAAAISHRAQIVRNMVTRAEFGIHRFDAFAAWSPLYHMGAMDNSLGTLMSGGKVVIVDGFDIERLLEVVEQEQLGWLLLMPGMVGRFAEALERSGTKVRSVRVCGVMADLVPRREIARVTRLLQAPYANTFGATETGCPPCSSSLIPIGVVPETLAKQQSQFCEVRLVDSEDEDVTPGSPGELCMRGPTLFSGYYRDAKTNSTDFRGGWFHMGDVFLRNPDSSLEFVDRVKYLIKSGGENIYPAEIENVLLGVPGVLEASVVRRPDDRWGEVPVAFVARQNETLTMEHLVECCRAQLASYKRPKAIEFLALDEFPRSASGKVQRHELEKRYLSRP